MYDKLVKREAKLSLIGLGYVGLPIALEFAKKISVVGFDIRPDRIELMKKGIDPSNELEHEAFEGTDIKFTADPQDLREASFHIIAVPTPVTRHNLPDLEPVLKASETVGRILKKGDYVVYESTVYPGCTEEECIPVLERYSGLKCPSDFKVGFSPERINPGDKNHTLTKIIKVTSGCDAESSENIAKTYEMIIEAGVHRTPSIKVAEAAKVIENTQRDINIAFMNELSIIFNRMGINTYDVLEAAGTKWNFLKFYPGLVGGHCIGVDPYYLSYKAKAMGYHPQMIDSGRFTNDSMGAYVGKETVKKLIAASKSPDRSRVLIMGMTFKEDVTDIRNSKVIDVVNELRDFGVEVDVIDPGASQAEVKHEYGIDLKKGPERKYDAIIVAVAHKEYRNLDEKFFLDLLNEKGILVDLKGMYRNRMKWLTYWSL
ncbi:MAG TPA: nucleotide sugar dehydrogenase [Bacteroidales bacterium]|jgi:UDP-N-acetyl-D-galactosamine dehydrogenase|nr:nucleotide sugar dehydrogenase [Bacteroidales bacterium]MBP7036608.1 nucleotide sugar dehydrogenase [Bacteroidales bacterium]MBP8709506.1 nucleotide sugar dehydrogenase [Bacteroidales bacterium]MDI9533030.1 nucleotide sugar dehydrogenase [Bacteroidota bacterium]HPA68706.1 nucleotide sugar dehydrogenase [Bacteroidales bacterium]